jgi:aminocarboxymuconate-semialdehyde decarboxylase
MAEPEPVIDVHHHFLPRAVFERLRAEAGGGRRLVNEHISITLSDELHDAQAHLRTMDEAGVDAAILTYSGVSLLGPEVCRLLNDGLAELRRAYPGRLLNTVHVSLHDPDAARELERGARELGAAAVALPTSERGKGLDDPSLLPLWRRVADLDLPVILHPALLPPGAPTDYGLERSCARPFDTTIAAARIAYGVLPRVPNLRVVLPHLGGTAVFLRGRLAMFFDPADPKAGGLAKTLREQRRAGHDARFEAAWSCFYYDTAGSGAWPPAAEMTARVVGPARMLFGSDYPLEARTGETVREILEMIEALPLQSSERRAIAGGNAQALFRLDPAPIPARE